VYPDVFQWGFIHIRSYGLMLAVAFLVGTWLGLKEARRRGLDEDHLVTVILVTLVASVLGARALYVTEHVDDFRREWSGVLAVWQGGLTLYGGIIAGTVAGLWAARRLRMPMWAVADALAPSVALGTMFGRIGCFLNGCCYGRPTHLPWGIVFPPESFAGLEFGSTPVHPAQLYFSAAGLVMFVALWRMRTRVVAPGVLFWSFIVMFTLTRSVLDFTRAYESAAVIVKVGRVDLTESQFTSFAMAMFGLLMIVRLRRSAEATAAPAPAPSP
jgi:phosphatidylglycerol---prolipoprotein diacylglyceryl transferase